MCATTEIAGARLLILDYCSEFEENSIQDKRREGTWCWGTMIHICAVLYIDWCPWLASHWLSSAAVVNADYYISLWKLQCHSQFVTTQTSVATWLAWRPLPSVLWLAPYSKLQTGQWICSKEYTQMVCFLEGTIISVLLKCSPIPSVNNVTTMSGQLETVNQQHVCHGLLCNVSPTCLQYGY